MALTPLAWPGLAWALPAPQVAKHVDTLHKELRSRLNTERSISGGLNPSMLQQRGSTGFSAFSQSMGGEAPPREPIRLIVGNTQVPS